MSKLYATTIVTTYSGMKVTTKYNTDLNAAIIKAKQYLKDNYPSTLDILNTFDDNIQPLILKPIDPNNIVEFKITSDDYSYTVTANHIELWIAYKDGDIFIQIDDVTDNIPHNDTV